MPLNLGVRAHDFGKLPPEELACRISAQGLTCIQLAPSKALAGFDTDEAGFPEGFATSVADTFRRHGIRISVLGCYINLADREEHRRRSQLERFKRHLRVARAFDCAIVGTETGSLNADFSRHPENGGEEAFQLVLRNVRELVAEAERLQVQVGIEAVERYVISNPARLRRLLDEVSSPNLCVIYDPVNLLWSSNYLKENEILAEAHQVLGPWIRVVHAKDYTLDSGTFLETSAGAGQLNYQKVFRWLKTIQTPLDLILENTQPSTLPTSLRFLQKTYEEA